MNYSSGLKSSPNLIHAYFDLARLLHEFHPGKVPNFSSKQDDFKPFSNEIFDDYKVIFHYRLLRKIPNIIGASQEGFYDEILSVFKKHGLEPDIKIASEISEKIDDIIDGRFPDIPKVKKR